jgi:hypothetical protein
MSCSERPQRSGVLDSVARGTAHLRTHVDIDLESRLAKLEACWRRASGTAAG